MTDIVRPVSGDTAKSRTIFALVFVVPIFAVLLYGSTDIGALIPISILIGFLAGAWIIRSWRSGVFEINADPILLPMIGLSLLTLLQILPLGDAGLSAAPLSVPASSALTLDPYSTQIFFIRLIVYMIFLAAVLTFIDSEQRYRRAVAVVLIFGGLIAFVGILQKLASPEAIYGVRTHSGANPFGPYINSHHFASLMVLISGIGVAHMLGRGIQQQTKLLIGISVGLMAIAVPLTNSRGGVLAYTAMICVAVLAWFYGRQTNERPGLFPLVAGGAALGMIVIGSVIYLGGEGAMLRGFGIDGPSADISSGRFHFWSVAWKIFLENPIIGAGMDAFGVAYTQFDTQNGVYRVEQAHNDYLQMLADGGVIGLLLAAAFIFILIKQAVTRLKSESESFLRVTIIGGLAGCVGIFVHSLFDFPLRTVGNAFVFLLVVGVILAPVNSRMFKASGREQ